MTSPAIIITQLDGALGTLPPSGGKALAVLGPSDSGTLNTPAAYARPGNVTTAFTGGPLVQLCNYYINNYGRNVIAVRTAASTVGIYSTIDVTGVTGTSVHTLDATTHPNDAYDVVIKYITGGTRGVAGITYQYSLDGTRNWSATTALGTASSIVLPSTTGGIKIDLAAGTIIANDTVRFSAIAPCFTAADLTTALTALKNSNLPWDIAIPVGSIDASIFDAIETGFAAMQAVGKWRAWVGGTRMPNVGETESAYKTAMDAIFTAKSTLFGSLYAGDVKISSANGRGVYRRPAAWLTACREASVTEEVNIADPKLGALPAASLVDANGNPENHDEIVTPGLDDSRYGTLRTWVNRNGVYVNRPRIFSTSSSDFQIMPYRRVMNLYAETIIPYLQERLNSPVIVSATTGYILESEADEIERVGRALLRAVLRSKPKVSDVQFAVSRTDNLLSTKTLTCDGGIVPLAYPEFINLTLGLVNPSLQLIAA